MAHFHARWRACELRSESFGYRSPSRHLHGPDSQGRAARRRAGRAIPEVRLRHQPEDGENARPPVSAGCSCRRRRGARMRRREVITLLGGTALAWPLTMHAQQDGRVRRIGILERGAETDGPIQLQYGAMREELAKLGWIEGRNVRFAHRFSADDTERLRVHADELVRLAPDVVVVSSLAATRILQQRTKTIPIVFGRVGDPVAGGLLQNIARPEGNVTGVTNYQSLAGKWLELLKEAAPRTTRIALIFVPGIAAENYFAVIDTAAEVLGVKAIHTPYRNAAELERTIDAFGAEPNGGLTIVP